MVLLTVTPAAHEAARAYNKHNLGKDVNADEYAVLDLEIGQPVSHGQLIQISNALKSRHNKHGDVDCDHDLESLLRGSTIYVAPPKPKPEKSPEYLQLMARLREEEERRAYERMINPLPTTGQFAQGFPTTNSFNQHMYSEAMPPEVDEATFSDINRQMTLIINVLVTIIACSAGIWITAWHWPTPARLALSMVGSGVVAVAEVVIYFGYIKRLSDAKTKEAHKKESKQIVETWVFDGKTKSIDGRNETLRQRKGRHR